MDTKRADFAPISSRREATSIAFVLRRRAAAPQEGDYAADDDTTADDRTNPFRMLMHGVAGNAKAAQCEHDSESLPDMRLASDKAGAPLFKRPAVLRLALEFIEDAHG
jgi:hypothetical protein